MAEKPWAEVVVGGAAAGAGGVVAPQRVVADVAQGLGDPAARYRPELELDLPSDNRNSEVQGVGPFHGGRDGDGEDNRLMDWDALVKVDRFNLIIWTGLHRCNVSSKFGKRVALRAVRTAGRSHSSFGLRI